MKIRRSEIVLLAQAAAVLLPVAALAGAALHLLHQDKADLEREARERAHTEILQRVQALYQEMTLLAIGGVTASIQNGEPWAPGDYPRQPEPSAREPQSAAALARLEAAEQSGAADLIPQAIEVASRYPAAVTESGTPVAPLAILVALRHAGGAPLPPALASALRRNVIDHPTFLTPELLRAAKQPALAEEWSRAEAGRERVRARLRTIAPGLVGMTTVATLREADANPPWMALCQPAPNGWKVLLTDDLKVPPTAPYASVTVAIDGTTWRNGPEANGEQELDSFSGRLNVPGPHSYQVSIALSIPQLLYSQYDRRLKLYQWLICCGAATALIGLASLWLGYRRQARLSAMKSNFVSSVSHELRAPLAAVRLMAESLDSGRITEEARQRDYYRLIVQECRRLSAMVENVLDLARIGSGRKSYRFEPVDVTALVRQSVALMEHCAAERHIVLRLVDNGPDGGHPAWDAQAVEQSLVNLLDNAIQHSPPGAEVRVAVEQDAENWRVWVEDCGPGIPLREQRRIFEMVYRHGAELRRQTKGVGIGLSIVRHVAEAHGGRVIVESEVGRGSRFALELPVEHRS